LRRPKLAAERKLSQSKCARTDGSRLLSTAMTHCVQKIDDLESARWDFDNDYTFARLVGDYPK